MKYFLVICVLLVGMLDVNATIMEGGVSKNGATNQIVDSQTNLPVAGAKICLPKQNYVTETDINGAFNLDIQINNTSVLSVEKAGYRPFSVTINENIASRPIVLSIEKSNAQDIVISAEMFHLGDNNFSSASANSSDFKVQAIGPFYTKTFTMSVNAQSKKNYLLIGSIIGVDTLMARSLKQNSIVNSFASPPEIYFNGTKIAEIQLNGDGQRINLPNALVHAGGLNEITIKTGRNLKQTAYIDYDDIEFMNLSILSE